MSYLYACLAETLSDVLSEVEGDNESQTASIERLLNAASGLVDKFTKRPAGYFLGIGTNSGSRQKMSIEINAAGLAKDCTVRMTITAAGLSGSPIRVDVPADHPSDTSTTIATALFTAIGLNATLAAFFNIANPSAGIVTLENKTAGAFDLFMSAKVEGLGTGTGIVITHSTPLATPAIMRRYRGTGRNFLQIGRHVAGSISIANVAASLYYEHTENGWPYAADVAAQPGSSYELSDYPIGEYRGCELFAKGGLYEVSARYGFAVTPDEISFATKLITQQLWDRGKGVIGQISPTGFVVERDIPLTARAMLEPWIRREFEAN